MEEKTFEGTYIGREFKEGVKKDNTPWTMYTLKFKPDEGQQYGPQFSVFVFIMS